MGGAGQEGTCGEEGVGETSGTGSGEHAERLRFVGGAPCVCEAGSRDGLYCDRGWGWLPCGWVPTRSGGTGFVASGGGMGLFGSRVGEDAMRRRDLFRAGVAGLVGSAMSRELVAALWDQPAKRVGLIGSGWYGKCDVLRLIQVAPVEVVSICDVDSQMLDGGGGNHREPAGVEEDAADVRGLSRDAGGEGSGPGVDRHAGSLACAADDRGGGVGAGRLCCRSRFRVDVMEGEAMLAAARKHGRVVQVGTQRRSTPHLIEARDRIIREGKLGKIGHVEIYCYYHMRARIIRRISSRRRTWTGTCGRGRRRCGRTTGWCIRGGGGRSRSIANGILGDMCIHMLDTVRWMLELGWPTRVTSEGRDPGGQGEQGERPGHADGDV